MANSRPLRALFRELKRRKVFGSVGIYAAAAFVAWQVAEIGVPALGLPDAVLTAVVVLTLLGLPLVVVLAWLFEMTPGGLRRHEHVVRSADGEGRTLGASGAAAVGIAVGLLTLAGGGLWLGTRSGADASGVDAGALDADRIAVFPFAVRGGEEVADLREGLADLLSLTLDGAGELQTVDNHALLGRLGREAAEVPDPERAHQVAASFGAGLFVLGSVVELGDGLEVSATLYRTGAGEVDRAGRTAGSAAEIHDVVDGLSADLIRALPESTGVRAARLGGLTTESLPALKAFMEGEAIYRRADFRGAIEAFERAVSHDPEFALAHYRLALAASWNGDDLDLGVASIERAAELSGRLTDRDRRLVQALRSFLSWDWADAERRFRAATGLYPDDLEAWYWLGDLLYHSAMLRGGRMTDAAAPLARVLELSPEEVEPMFHAAVVARVEGRLDDAREIVDRYLRLAPESQFTPGMRMYRQILENDTEAALASLRGADEFNAFLTAFYQGGMGVEDASWLQRAASVMAEPGRSNEMRAVAHAVLAHVAAGRGRWDEALEQSQLAGEMDVATGLVHEGLIRLHPAAPTDLDGLRRYRERLRAWDASSVPPRMLPVILMTEATDYPLFRAYLLGVTAAALEEPATAMRIADELEGRPATPGSASGPADLARAVRAEVARRAGRPHEALELLSAQERRVRVFDIFNSPIFGASRERFLQGELLGQLGEPAAARRWYEGLGEASFFEFSYVPYARDAMATLAGHPGPPG